METKIFAVYTSDGYFFAAKYSRKEAANLARFHKRAFGSVFQIREFVGAFPLKVEAV